MHKEENNNQELKALIESYEEAKKIGQVAYFEEDAFISIADYFLTQQNMDATLQVLEEAIEFYPYSVELWLLKSSVFLLQNNIQESLDILDKVDSMSPSNLGSILLKSEIFIHLGQYEDAVALLDEYEPTGESEEHFFFLYFKGMAYQEMESHKEALACFQEAFLLNAEETSGFDFMWDSVLELEQQAEFVDYLNKVLEKAPYNEEAWYYLALSYKNVGLYEKAIDAFEFSTAVNASSKSLLDGADMYFEMKQYEAAQKWYIEAEPLLNHKEYIYFQLAKTNAALKRNSKAMTYYRQVVEVNPDNDGAYFSMGCLYYYSEQWRQAENDLRKAIELNPHEGQYHYILAQVLAAQKEVDQAIETLREAVRLEPTNISFLLSLIDLLLMTKQAQKTLPLFEDMREMAIAHPDLTFAEAACLFTVGRNQQGKVVLLRALNESEGLSSVFFEIAPNLQLNSEVLMVIEEYKK